MEHNISLFAIYSFYHTAIGEHAVDLISFKALITEAEEHDLPLCPLLEALTLTVTEACKCSAVIDKLLSNKVSTRSVN